MCFEEVVTWPCAWPQAQALLDEPPSDKRVRLLVIDSIANVFRDVGDNAGVRQYAARSNLFFQARFATNCELQRLQGPSPLSTARYAAVLERQIPAANDWATGSHKARRDVKGKRTWF